jgi:hypothetical protein
MSITGKVVLGFFLFCVFSFSYLSCNGNKVIAERAEKYKVGKSIYSYNGSIYGVIHKYENAHCFPNGSVDSGILVYNDENKCYLPWFNTRAMEKYGFYTK